MLLSINGKETHFLQLLSSLLYSLSFLLLCKQGLWITEHPWTCLKKRYERIATARDRCGECFGRRKIFSLSLLLDCVHGPVGSCKRVRSNHMFERWTSWGKDWEGSIAAGSGDHATQPQHQTWWSCFKDRESWGGTGDDDVSLDCRDSWPVSLWSP